MTTSGKKMFVRKRITRLVFFFFSKKMGRINCLRKSLTQPSFLNKFQT